MKTHAIEKVIEEDALVAIGGTEHRVVRKDRFGCVLRTTVGKPFDDYYWFTELGQIEEDGLLSIRPPALRGMLGLYARKHYAGRVGELIALYAARYDDPTRPTVSDLHRALAAEIWKSNNDLNGEATMRCPCISTLRRAITDLMKVPGFGRRRAGRTYRGF
jgi:hypothetical protein